MTSDDLKANLPVNIAKDKTRASLKFKVGTRSTWVPPGNYQVIVKEIKMTTPYKNKPVIEFLFEIASGDNRGVQLRVFCNGDYTAFSGATKLYQWHAVVSGDDFECEELDMSIFYDKLIEVGVVEKISKKTKIKFSNVLKIIRVLRDL